MAQTFEELSAALAEAREKFTEALAAHERDVHDGRPCWPNRAGAIAWFAHGIGINAPMVMSQVFPILARYDRHCPDPECRHGKGPLN